jgi:hypothetical protein
MGDVYVHTKCGSELARKPRMFHWRGRDFPGLVCEKCMALWSDPNDSFCAHVGLPDEKNGIERRGAADS